MKNTLDNSTIVIAGAGSGLGRASALLAAKKGYNVVLLGRSIDKLNETQSLLSVFNISSDVYAIDLTNELKTMEVFKIIKAKYGQPRALINCVAKWMGRKAITDVTNSELMESFSVNFFTSFNTISQTLKIWEENKKPLSIVNVGATSSLSGRANVLAFGLGKGALRTLSQSLARELGCQGVHVSHLIIDGLLDNPRTKSISKDVPDENFMNQTDVAESILFLIEQEKSCWTFELDVRPFNERF